MEERQRLNTDQQELLGKSEILLVDGDASAHKVVSGQLEAAGLLVTATADSGRALTLAREKHFAVIIVDADTPQPGEGIAQLKLYASASPASAVMLLCAEERFDLAVEGFRAGAADVASKERLDVMAGRVVELCLETLRSDERLKLLKDTMELHDLFLRRLMEAHRRAEMAEELAAGQSTVTGPCVLLVVDDNPRTAPGLQQALGPESKYRCVGVPTGGEALDHGGSEAFDLVLVNESLPDLPGSMVAKTLCSQMKDAIVLLFEHPGGAKPGHAAIIEPSQTIDLIPELKTANQLVERLRGLNEATSNKKREKRYVRSFRESNTEFLKQYVGVRKRIQQLLPDKQG